MADIPPPPSAARVPLRYRLNPCDIERAALLAPLGDGIAALWRGFTHGTECPCCLGTRLLLALALAGAAGAGLALVLR